jgi:hypothetical protein
MIFNGLHYVISQKTELFKAVTVQSGYELQMELYTKTN